MKKVAFLMCLWLCLYGCKGKPGDYKDLKLSAETLFSSDDLDDTTPWGVCLIGDSLLVTQQFRHKTCLDVWNLHTKKHLNSLLESGEGDTEAMYPVLQPCGKESSLYVNDLQNKNMYKIEYGELLSPTPQIKKVLHWDGGENDRIVPGWIFYMGNDSYFSINVKDSMRYIMRNAAGAVCAFGEFPDKDMVDSNLTSELNASLYLTASVAVSPDYKRLAVFQWYADMVTLIEPDRHNPIISSKINAYPNDISIISTDKEVVGYSTTGKTYLYYSNVSWTKEYIYVLWEGYRCNNDLNFSGKARSKTVKVFDWDGNLHYVLHLNRPVLSICVTSDNRNIIATTDMNNGYGIYRYKFELD